jgi:flavin-dependent dehydrogenase
VHVQHECQTYVIATSVVIAADGLAGRFGANDDGVVARGSLMGAGVVVDGAPSWCEPGVIYMACGHGGYAGVARLERGRVAVSAALDPRQAREAGGPAAMVRRLFDEAGLSAPCELEAQRWKGTPLLTRRRRDVASMRCLVAGDATGYVEPFTGEGIAWALESGVAAARIAHEGAREWKVALADEWQRVQRRMLGWRRLRCYWLTRALRSPTVAHTAIALLAHVPTLASPIVRGVSSGWSHEPAWGR